MNKKFKKVVSIFVITVFVLASLSCNVLADLTASKWGGAMPWTGDNTPLAQAVLNDGTTNLSSAYAVTSAGYPVITSVSGAFGKDEEDKIYKTYDMDSRTTLSAEGGGFIAHTSTSNVGLTAGKDLVLSFSFAYSKAGGAVQYNQYSDGLLMQSHVRSQAYSPASRIDMYNPIAIRKDGIRICDNSKNDLTGLKDKYFFKYAFEPNQWYNVDFVFDFENKATSTDENLQSEYKWSAYVNGKKIGENTTTQSFYQFNAGWFRWFPAYGAEMYWDNMMCYNIDSAGSFDPDIDTAELSSSDSTVAVDGSKIKIDSLSATAGEVKSAVEASLKAGETLRIYNSDYTQELGADSAALGAKVVVAGTEALTSTLTAENIFTYYDVVAGKAAFDEPVITTSTDTASGTVDMHNYTGEAQSFKGYLAVYNGTELVALGVADFEAEADETEVKFSIDDVPYAAGNTAKFFVWKADGITPELASK